MWFNKKKGRRKMGDVKEEVKGSAPKRKAKTPGAENILGSVRSLKDELSELVTMKDDDVQKEGDAAKPENQRKAATLRASSALLVAIESLLEDY